MPRQTKITKKVRKFIVEKMSEGYNLQEISRRWPTQMVVQPNTLYKRTLTDPELAEDLDQGYTLWYYAKMEELDRLSSVLASEEYPNVDFREAEATLKRRVDALKFALGKMAPVMSKRFNRAQKVEVDNKNQGPQIQVLNYHSPAPQAIDSKVIDVDVLT